MSLDKKDFKVEKSGNVATVTCTNEDAFYEGTDISKKDIKAVFDHSHQYIEECANAAAEQATAIMAKDKKVNEVTFSMPYGVSKRGEVSIKTRRSVTYPGINGSADVTRSDLRVVVKDPLTKMSKTKLRTLQKSMTEQLLK